MQLDQQRYTRKIFREFLGIFRFRDFSQIAKIAKFNENYKVLA